MAQNYQQLLNKHLSDHTPQFAKFNCNGGYILSQLHSELTVTSLNVQAKCCYVESKDGKCSYWNGPFKVNETDKQYQQRLKKQVESLVKKNSDVICLQEVYWDNADADIRKKEIMTFLKTCANLNSNYNIYYHRDSQLVMLVKKNAGITVDEGNIKYNTQQEDFSRFMQVPITLNGQKLDIYNHHTEFGKGRKLKTL